MGIDIGSQLAAFLGAVCLGMALGLVYDLLRALRLWAGGRGISLLDGVYCLVAGVSLFYFTLRFGDGELRLYMLLCTAGGFALFFLLFSALLRPLWDFWRECAAAALAIVLSPAVWLLRLLKKILVRQKKHFLFLKKWFTIIGKRWRVVLLRRGKPGKGGAANGKKRKKSA